MAAKTPASRMTEISTLSGHEVDYKVTHTSGLTHDPTFTMQATYRQFKGIGVASSKKAAKQKAANELLKILISEPPSDRIHGLEIILEGWNYNDLLSAAEQQAQAAPPKVFNSVGALHEFQAKNKHVQVQIKSDLPTEEVEGKRLFKAECTLYGKLDDDTKEPLTATASALTKKEARTKAADIVAQMLIEKGYLDRDTLKPIEVKKDECVAEIPDEPMISFSPPKLLGHLISLEPSEVKKEPASAVADWSDPLDNGNFILEPRTDLPKTDPMELLKLASDSGILVANSMSIDDKRKGSLEALTKKLDGTGLWIDVVERKETSEDNGIHDCILIIKSDKQKSLDLNSKNPSWIGRHQTIAIAKDLAAYRALEQLSDENAIEKLVSDINRQD